MYSLAISAQGRIRLVRIAPCSRTSITPDCLPCSRSVISPLQALNAA
jgi:hypothetical protein